MTVTVDPGVANSEQQAKASKQPPKLGIPKEIYPNEYRVAATPDTLTNKRDVILLPMLILCGEKQI